MQISNCVSSILSLKKQQQQHFTNSNSLKNAGVEREQTAQLAQRIVYLNHQIVNYYLLI